MKVAGTVLHYRMWRSIWTRSGSKSWFYGTEWSV